MKNSPLSPSTLGAIIKSKPLLIALCFVAFNVVAVVNVHSATIIAGWHTWLGDGSNPSAANVTLAGVTATMTAPGQGGMASWTAEDPLTIPGGLFRLEPQLGRGQKKDLPPWSSIKMRLNYSLVYDFLITNNRRRYEKY
jgi:hypothetical protein